MTSPDLEDFTVPRLFPIRTQIGYHFVRLQSPAWPELEQIFTECEITTPLTFLPPELFLELLFLHACKRSKIPASSGTVYNLMWNVSAMEQVHHDCIISLPSIVHFLLKKIEVLPCSTSIKTIVLLGTPDKELEAYIKKTLPNAMVRYINNPLLAYV